MKTLLIPLLVIFYFRTAFAISPIQEKVDFLCSQIISSPQFRYADYFAPQFIDKISYEQLISILSEIYKDDGKCHSTKIITTTHNSAKIKLFTQSTSQKFIITLDSNNLISGLKYSGHSDPKERISDIISLQGKINRFGDINSIYLKEYESGKELIKINSSKKIAIGSEFKLYVLKLLNQMIISGKHNWNDKLKIEELYKSLPSGILQDTQEGTELSIKDFASLMISISDNTATDHLIHLLGKEQIESSLIGYNSFIEQNIPFLSTMDLFRLRTLTNLEVTSYIEMNISKKRGYLDKLSRELNRKDVYEKLKNWTQPKEISQTEWFANAEDICSVLKNIKSQAESDKNIFEILSLNVPYVWVEDDPHFEYIGYKGGSEPGVLAMSFLLKTKSNKWACLSMGINNEKQPLNESEVSDLFHATLNYAGSLLNSKTTFIEKF